MATQAQTRVQADTGEPPAPAPPSLPSPPSPTPAKAARASRRPLVVLAIVAMIAGGWALARYLKGRHHVTSDDAQVQGHVVTIASKVQAFVSEVRVEDNQALRAGDTLVLLDERDLAVRLRQAEADLAAAEAAVGSSSKPGQADAQLAWSEATASSSAAAVTAAQATVKKAAADLERYRGLAAKQIVPAQQLDAAQAAYDAAAANLEALQRNTVAAGSQVSSYGAALRAAGARLAAARATVDNARLQLSYTAITAPVNGTIARRSVEPGALVQVGQTLMTLTSATSVWVTANLKETELANVKVGDSVTFEVDTYRGSIFHGHVESMSPATGATSALLPPDNATGNFTKVVQRVPVRIAVDGPVDPSRPLRLGMSVVVDITTK